jgi:hypothetical protein
MYEEIKARPAYIVDEVINPPAKRSEGGASRTPAEREPA